MKVSLIYAAPSFYEILLIVLVLVFIFNGLLKRQILKKTRDNLTQKDYSSRAFEQNKPLSGNSIDDDEYVDYEIIKD